MLILPKNIPDIDTHANLRWQGKGFSIFPLFFAQKNREKVYIFPFSPHLLFY